MTEKLSYQQRHVVVPLEAQLLPAGLGLIHPGDTAELKALLHCLAMCQPILQRQSGKSGNNFYSINGYCFPVILHENGVIMHFMHLQSTSANISHLWRMPAATDTKLNWAPKSLMKVRSTVTAVVKDHFSFQMFSFSRSFCHTLPTFQQGEYLAYFSTRGILSGHYRKE